VTRPRALSLALGFLELDPPELIDVAAAAGFSSVSLRTWAAATGGVEYPLSEGSSLARETGARMDATGVGVLQIEVVSLARSVAIDGYRPSLEGGAALGAERVVACGEDDDPAVLADRLSTLCELADELGLEVDVEFMPFRRLGTFGQALDLVERVGRPNGHVMVDALHLFRSGGTTAEVASAPPPRIGVCQLCDAPKAAPPRELLATEARERRLPPGSGELPLRDLLPAIPADVPVAAEVRNDTLFAGFPAVERARVAFRSTSGVLGG
jgi:sugar phosphate isomerase/epimerase